MERLTNKREADLQRKRYEKRLEQGYPRNIPEERFLRLAAYEDSDLTPEQVAAMKTELQDERYRHDRQADFTVGQGQVIDQLKEQLRVYQEAEKDGRLHILPVNVGAEVYWIIYDQVTGMWSLGEPEKIADVGTKGFYLSADLDEPGNPDEFHSWDELGGEVFLNREEAEAKLAEIQAEKAAPEGGGNHA